MTNNDLKRMSRAELLVQTIELMRQNEALSEEIAGLKSRLWEAREKLKSRDIEIGKTGSIAEAAMKLNGVFEAAQATADQYLENIERLNRETKAECDRMLEETRLKCHEMEVGTQRNCSEIYSAAQAEAMQNWSRVSQALQSTLSQVLQKDKE